jgi:hypothetical protein
MSDRWTFYHLGNADSLAVYLCPPGGAGSPRAFSLPGLSPAARRRLSRLRRGDVVPGDVLEALLSLNALPGPADGWSGKALR